jgi:hypothetical protein
MPAATARAHITALPEEFRGDSHQRAAELLQVRWSRKGAGVGRDHRDEGDGDDDRAEHDAGDAEPAEPAGSPARGNRPS